jgi:hypothetical protein
MGNRRILLSLIGWAGGWGGGATNRRLRVFLSIRQNGRPSWKVFRPILLA